MKYCGVIFDMDGTLTEPFFDFRAIETEVGITGVDLVDYMLAASEAERQRIKAILQKHEDHAAENAPIRAGARELLLELRQRKIPVALLTRNTRRSIEMVCSRLDLKFEITLSREDGHFKPKPEPVWHICRQWNLSAAQVLVVGDYKYDVECGKAAGSKTVLLVQGDEIPEWGRGADFFIRHLLELREILGLTASIRGERTQQLVRKRK
jgi:HAD superfamily hydrolase (TIGR01549 family)